MEIMSQERYKEYREDLKIKGYPVIETTTYEPTEETYKILEERLGKMPWDLLKMEKVDGRRVD